MKGTVFCVTASLAACFLTPQAQVTAQTVRWPEQTATTKPGSRWWWLGSAVDSDNLRRNIREYARAGIGALEITPVYGVCGNESRELDFLSSPWMEALRFSEEEGRRNGVLIGMNTGTGWPFGGPSVPLEEAACKAVFADTTLTGRDFRGVSIAVAEKERSSSVLQTVMAFSEDGKATDITSCASDGRLTWTAPAYGKYRFIALYAGRTRQKVKRAAPGGEGYVIDHFDRNAVKHYLENIEKAFAATDTPYPHTFFNDSYEVYGADWTPSLPDEFRRRRGYSLEESLCKLLDNDAQTLSDYRETLGELLLENFTEQWTAWAHRHGATTRNQAHGSPANLIDVYAAVDIPETEGFGLTDFGIRGLRRDSAFTRKNDSDISMLKYASSAAHITGKPLTSSETFTWLTEHFRTSLSQMKPDLDLMFTCGVNHVFFHGTAYSPADAPWPGWKFYASADMSPTNSIWRDAPDLMAYIDRCQRFLQMGEPDNDFLVYLPVRDMWRQTADGRRLMQFDIHGMKRKAPGFIRDVLRIDSLGYDLDYISDRYLLTATAEEGLLKTAAGTRYRALILPEACAVPQNVMAHLDSLRARGVRIITGIDAGMLASAASPEPVRLEGLRAIRRRNAGGFHYFIANLSPHDVRRRIRMAVECGGATWFNPLNGDILPADVGKEGVMVDMKSGESRILLVHAPDGTAAKKNTATPADTSASGGYIYNKVSRAAADTVRLDGKWTLSFIDAAPSVGKVFRLDSLQTWETIDDDSARVTMATGVYATTVRLSRKQARKHWTIDLGDVRESARVYVNGRYIGCAWAVPFLLDCRGALKAGRNEIRIEVTNLPANRIAWMDRRGVAWRRFRDINIVDINYRKTNYAGWTPVPSGLASEVRLVGRE